MQEKRMKTSDSYEMLVNQLSGDQSGLSQIIESTNATGKGAISGTKKIMRGLRESQDSNQRSQVFIGEKNGSSMGTNIKDASILTNYQQKQLQQLEQQSQAT